jgi:hypothetical protein
VLNGAAGTLAADDRRPAVFEPDERGSRVLEVWA